MSDFKIHENKSSNSIDYPFLIDVQSDLLSNLDTRLVIPLMRNPELRRHLIKNLNPIVRIGEYEYSAMTQQMAAIPKSVLGSIVDQVQFSRIEILNSIDFLITGI
jgi:toxin CcdB